MPLHVSSTCVHHQEVKIALHSLWYHQTYRWPSGAQVERGRKSSLNQAEACHTDTTPNQPHRNSNTHRTKKNTTNVVIQQNSHKLLIMAVLVSKTCWAHKKWNKIASDIKLVFYSSTTTMMHGPINIHSKIHQFGIFILDLFINYFVDLFGNLIERNNGSKSQSVNSNCCASHIIDTTCGEGETGIR